jgi:hypothetical protein
MSESDKKLISLLRKKGPCLASDLTKQLLNSNPSLNPATARKQVSRLKQSGNIRVLEGLNLPKNVSFLYLPEHFASSWYWSSLIKALLECRSAYGYALAAVKSRGDLIPESHFEIICGAPDKQSKHLSRDTILKGLMDVGLIKRVDISGVGQCLYLTQDDFGIESKIRELRARLAVESIILQATAQWLRNLGISSYGTVAVRDAQQAQPRVGTFSWDLTSPSYLFPLIQPASKTESSEGKAPIKNGYVACDVYFGWVDESAIKPFLKKVDTLRSLSKVGKCLNIFIAERYSLTALDALKKKGIIPATLKNLLGDEIAEAFIELSHTLRNALLQISDPEKLDFIFSKLGKLEGATQSIRGCLFEFLVAEIARYQNGKNYISMNKVYTDKDGKKAEIDVIMKGERKIIFIECKSTPPYSFIPHQEIEKWLHKRIPTVFNAVNHNPEEANLTKTFQLWTTGKLLPESLFLLNKAIEDINPQRYTIEILDAFKLIEIVRATENDNLLLILKKHFLNDPMASSVKH